MSMAVWSSLASERADGRPACKADVSYSASLLVCPDASIIRSRSAALPPITGCATPFLTPITHERSSVGRSHAAACCLTARSIPSFSWAENLHSNMARGIHNWCTASTDAAAAAHNAALQGPQEGSCASNSTDCGGRAVDCSTCPSSRLCACHCPPRSCLLGALASCWSRRPSGCGHHLWLQQLLWVRGQACCQHQLSCAWAWAWTPLAAPGFALPQLQVPALLPDLLLLPRRAGKSASASASAAWLDQHLEGLVSASSGPVLGCQAQR